MEDKKETEKFEENLIKQILINPKINRFDINNKTFVLDGVKFLMITNEYIKSNHKPIGLYINANDILRYIEQNLSGHDKNKFGIKKEVQEP